MANLKIFFILSPPFYRIYAYTAYILKKGGETYGLQ